MPKEDSIEQIISPNGRKCKMTKVKSRFDDSCGEYKI